jgi:cysteine-rich repeat protein
MCDDGNPVVGDGCTPDCQLEVCGDGLLVAGEACDDGNQIAGDGCSPTCERDAYFVFVTAETFSGALGNIAAADARCQDSAAAAGLPGTYRAWLTFPGEPPAASFDRHDAPYVLPGSLAVVADGWLGLVSGALAHAIDRTAAGEELTGDVACNDAKNLAWTHTRATGSPFPGEPCSGWLLGSGTAVAGLVHATNLGWTEGCPDVDCAQKLHLYCVEQ